MVPIAIKVECLGTYKQQAQIFGELESPHGQKQMKLWNWSLSGHGKNLNLKQGLVHPLNSPVFCKICLNPLCTYIATNVQCYLEISPINNIKWYNHQGSVPDYAGWPCIYLPNIDVWIWIRSVVLRWKSLATYEMIKLDCAMLWVLTLCLEFSFRFSVQTHSQSSK